jgi:hypothetical protein
MAAPGGQYEGAGGADRTQMLTHGIGVWRSRPSPSVELAILELLGRHDRLAVERIGEVVGAPQCAVAIDIRALAEQGLIRRVGATGWTLTDAERRSATLARCLGAAAVWRPSN